VYIGVGAGPKFRSLIQPTLRFRHSGALHIDRGALPVSLDGSDFRRFRLKIVQPEKTCSGAALG
jgi:hypothetical protein